MPRPSLPLRLLSALARQVGRLQGAALNRASRHNPDAAGARVDAAIDILRDEWPGDAEVASALDLLRAALVAGESDAASREFVWYGARFQEMGARGLAGDTAGVAAIRAEMRQRLVGPSGTTTH